MYKTDIVIKRILICIISCVVFLCVFKNSVLRFCLTKSGGGVMLSGMPSGCASLTPISRDASSLRILETFQRHSPKIFIM